MTTYLSENITISKGTEWELDGILTLPPEATKAHPVPAVILVHGSRAHDKDETLFENKPFLDIADYLSRNGIAVLRYDKRTFTHGEKMMETSGVNLTVWEETIEDAILAGNLAKADPRIDKTRVFMLGHSQGGMMAPRTHASGGDFAGLILFAATPRLITDAMISQNHQVLASMEDGPEKAAVQAQVDEFITQIHAMYEMTEEEAKKALFFGQPAWYLKEMAMHPFADYVKNSSVPMLVMQAERDLQVLTDVDFAELKALLAGREDVTFRLYEGLNHLFMPSTTDNIMELMAEYEIPAHIDGQVLRDIAAWVKGV